MKFIKNIGKKINLKKLIFFKKNKLSKSWKRENGTGFNK
jgi:hypothetical protein